MIFMKFVLGELVKLVWRKLQQYILSFIARLSHGSQLFFTLLSPLFIISYHVTLKWWALSMWCEWINLNWKITAKCQGIMSHAQKSWINIRYIDYHTKSLIHSLKQCNLDQYWRIPFVTLLPYLNLLFFHFYHLSLSLFLA